MLARHREPCGRGWGQVSGRPRFRFRAVKVWVIAVSIFVLFTWHWWTGLADLLFWCVYLYLYLRREFSL